MCTTASKAGSGGSAQIRNSNATKQQMIQDGLNSKFAGVRRDAEQGTGIFAFKNAVAAPPERIEKLNAIYLRERNGNSIAFGVDRDGKEIFFADKSDSPQIERIKKIKESRSEKRAKEIEEDKIKIAGSDKNTTTTYERWRKNNLRKFNSWYGRK